MTTALNPIAIGTTPGDGTGDIPRAGFTKVKSDHANFLSAIGYRQTSPGTFGVATSGASTTVLTDTTQTWATNQFAGQTLTILTGTNAGYSGTIASNTATTITLNAAINGSNNIGASGYEVSTKITTAGSDGFATSVGGTSPSTVIDANQAWTSNQWTGYGVSFLAGYYAGQQIPILSNTSTTLTLSIPLANAIAAGTPYVIGLLPINATFSSAISATLTTNQNNYAPTGWGVGINKLKITPSGATIQLTGLSATGFADGAQVLLENRDTTLTYNVTLLHASSSSSSANQFLLPGGSSYSLIPFQKALLVYDLATTSWGILS